MPVQMPVRDEAVLKRRSEIVRALRAMRKLKLGLRRRPADHRD
jgi:hypothetical protein